MHVFVRRKVSRRKVERDDEDVWQEDKGVKGQLKSLLEVK